MFSAMCVCQSVCSEEVGPHVTYIHDVIGQSQATWGDLIIRDLSPGIDWEAGGWNLNEMPSCFRCSQSMCSNKRS